MDQATRIKRHAKLWETDTNRIQRIAFGGVIFAIVILFNVIEPHWKNERNPDFIKLQGELKALEREQEKNADRMEGLNRIGITIDEIKKSLEDSPWDDHVQELLEFCKNGCPAGTKAKADAVITNIANDLQELIVAKLRAAIDKEGLSDDFGHYTNTIEVAINDWKRDKLRIDDWWQTRGNKRSTANEAGEIARLSASQAESKLGGLSAAATDEIERTKTALKEKQNELKADTGELGKQIAEQKKIVELALKSALPSWARELVTPKRMIVLYPWILIAITALLLVNALNARHHFRGMADAEGWSAEERSDPLLSSPWTLTWRGYIGFAITLLYYGAVLGILSYCLYRSFDAATVAGTAVTSTEAAPENPLTIFTMPSSSLAYGLLALAALIVFFMPLWRRAR